MALRKIIETEGQVVIQTLIGLIPEGTKKITFSSYVKVESIKGNKDKVEAVVSMTGENQRFSKTYNVDVSVADGSPNFIKQVYNYLKTLPEFDGAIDC